MLETVVGELGLKKRWRQLKARKQQLPESHRKAHDAVERYLMYAAGIADGAILTAMAEDLLELFEQGAADGTPVSAIVGDNPVEFAEEFATNYSEGAWIKKERARLEDAIKTITDGDLDKLDHKEDES
jgi:DNA-binding ferritin-like protein (Dps family)